MADDIQSQDYKKQESNDNSDEVDASRPNTTPGRYHNVAKSRVIRWTSRGPVVRWGTQEQLTPPTEAALKASCTPRLELLAKPKANMRQNIPQSLYMYSCGRNSALWLVTEGAMTAECSARVDALAKHKEPLQSFQDRPNKNQHMYDCGRSSPIWSISDAAKNAPERPHTAKLAQYKTWHRDYRPERELPSNVSESARNSACPPRIEDLAKPKLRQNSHVREPIWQVLDVTKKANASHRLLELAQYRPVYEGYHYNYDQGAGYEKLPQVIRTIPANAKRAMTSSRTEELSKPIIRETMDKVQFDPNAFIIKRAALTAYCPARIAELATPVIKS